MATTIDKYQDILDSRDIIARIEELEKMRQDALDNGEDVEIDELDFVEGIDAEELGFGTFSQGEREELAILKALAEQCEPYAPDWAYGEMLIRDSYFETYAEDLAADIGAIDPNLEGRWPYTCIDWEQAARELQQDYTSVDFDGVTYWISC